MLEDVLAQVQALDNAFRGKGSVAWYRGHRRTQWGLKSTLHRYVERLTSNLEKPLTCQGQRDLLRDEAKSLYRQFTREAWPLLGPAERSDWGAIFTMQHYSLPTRLLDWTENFACALFFAQQRRHLEDAAAVWVLDSEGLNELSLWRRGLVALEEATGASTVDVRGWHPRWVPPSDDLLTIAVSPIFTTIPSYGTPIASAAICANCVSGPCPCSTVPASTRTRPSGKSSAAAAIGILT